MRTVWLSSGNQVGIEIFEYLDPKAQRRINDNFEYWKSGFIHICITDPNIDELCRKISESGGKQRSKIWDISPGKWSKIAFCEDPFGNIIEIYTHSYEQTISRTKQSNTSRSINAQSITLKIDLNLLNLFEISQCVLSAA